MKDEIKEILDNLKFTNNDVMWCDKITLDAEESHLLLDYITNLQTIEQQYGAILSENAELENKITNLQKENKHLNLQLDQALKDYDELQQKIDKAIELTKNLLKTEDRGYYQILFKEILKSLGDEDNGNKCKK